MVMNPAVHARTVFEFIAYAEASPEKSTWRRRGIGDTIRGDRFEAGNLGRHSNER